MNSRRRPADEDASRDPANAEILAGLEQPEDGRVRPSQPSGGTQAAPDSPDAYSRRLRAARTARQPGPDSNMGLAAYFNDACPEPSWAHGMQLNSFKGLAAMFREMREHGLDADAIRALIDLYFQLLGERVPTAPYWLDFKGSRWRLLKALDTTGAGRTAADYEQWAQPSAPSPSAADQFAAGWRRHP